MVRVPVSCDREDDDELVLPKRRIGGLHDVVNGIRHDLCDSVLPELEELRCELTEVAEDATPLEKSVSHDDRDVATSSVEPESDGDGL